MRLLLHVQLYLQVTKVADGYAQTFFKRISSEKPGTKKLNEDINTRYFLNESDPRSNVHYLGSSENKA